MHRNNQQASLHYYILFAIRMKTIPKKVLFSVNLTWLANDFNVNSQNMPMFVCKSFHDSIILVRTIIAHVQSFDWILCIEFLAVSWAGHERMKIPLRRHENGYIIRKPIQCISNFKEKKYLYMLFYICLISASLSYLCNLFCLFGSSVF